MRAPPATTPPASPSGGLDVVPFRHEPMLASEVQAPFARPGWVFEEKYDGYRVIAWKEGARTTLVSRNGRDCSDRFPEIADSVARLPARSAAIDGEAVVLDEGLVSSFEGLQKRSGPVLFAAFDCLWLDGRDLREESLGVRREALERLVEGSDRIFPARRLAEDGIEAHREAHARGLEGLVAKDEAAPYRPGRSRSWLKVKIKQGDEFVVGGFTAGRGGRTHFGSLLLGGFDESGLRYVGRVGTGFDERTLAGIAARLRSLVVDRAPFVDPPDEPGVTWVEPRLVAQVAFAERTSDGRLRQPSFLGLRDDKDPRDCRWNGPAR